MVACLACVAGDIIACPSFSPQTFPRIEPGAEIVFACFGTGQLLSVICVVSSPAVSPWRFMKLW